MEKIRKPRRARCPYCGGKGVVEELISPDNGILQDSVRNTYNNEGVRIPNLTGTKEQCDEAVYIRANFVQLAKKRYKDEQFNTFIKLVSYEAHSLFWIWNKNSSLSKLIAKIAAKNPTAFELINEMCS